MSTRAALLARRALERDNYLLTEITRAILSERRWWTMPRLLDTVRSWLGASVTEAEVLRVLDVYEACGMVTRRSVEGRRDRFTTSRRAPGRARALRVALARSAEQRRACLAAAREMGREERERERTEALRVATA